MWSHVTDHQDRGLVLGAEAQVINAHGMVSMPMVTPHKNTLAHHRVTDCALVSEQQCQHVLLLEPHASTSSQSPMFALEKDIVGDGEKDAHHTTLLFHLCHTLTGLCKWECEGFNIISGNMHGTKTKCGKSI